LGKRSKRRKEIERVLIKDKAVLGFTPKQKKWFLARDDNQCQFMLDESEGMKEPRRCGNEVDLQLHHINPKGYAHFVLNWPEKKINSPDNGIILCKHHHLGRIHAEMELLGNFMYRFSEDSYSRLIQWHRVLTKAGIKYWWTYWDSDLKRRARARTWMFTHDDKMNPINEFPFRKERK